MDIDWKVVAQSPGYKSLKAAYIFDVHSRRHMYARDKEERYKKFQWVIGRAQHYADHTSLRLEEVLNQWEHKRDYWWVNFYQECNQPKLASGKPRNVKPIKPETYLKRDHWVRDGGEERFKRLKKHRQREARLAREKLGKKARWPAERKAQMARIREYRKQNL